MKFLKIFVLTLAFCVMVATSAMAAPFLVSAPIAASDANAPTSYLLTFDGGSEIETAVTVSGANVYLHYDLAGTTNGAHAVTVKAKNMWGASAASSSYSFSKGVPSVPTGISISPN